MRERLFGRFVSVEVLGIGKSTKGLARRDQNVAALQRYPIFCDVLTKTDAGLTTNLEERMRVALRRFRRRSAMRDHASRRGERAHGMVFEVCRHKPANARVTNEKRKHRSLAAVVASSPRRVARRCLCGAGPRAARPCCRVDEGALWRASRGLGATRCRWRLADLIAIGEHERGEVVGGYARGVRAGLVLTRALQLFAVGSGALPALVE
jgi:hypothetical protein